MTGSAEQAAGGSDLLTAALLSPAGLPLRSNANTRHLLIGFTLFLVNIKS